MTDFIRIEYDKKNDRFSSDFNLDSENYDHWIGQFETMANILKMIKLNPGMSFQQASNEVLGVNIISYTRKEYEV